MKKLFLILLVGVFITAAGATAQEEVAVQPGLTPDSPVYFLDDFFKSVRLTFTFNAERKADLRLKFAQEKLAEAEKMAEEKKEAAVEKALARYEEQVVEAKARAEGAIEERKASILEKVAEATSKHFEVLERVRGLSPEQAKEAIERAREVSERGNLEALRELAEKHTERAAEITARVIERRAELAEKLAERSEEFATKEAKRLEDFAKIAEEISSRADLDVTDEATRRRIKAHLEDGTRQADTTLRRVLEQVPDQAKPAIQRALENVQRVDRPRALEQIKIDVENLSEKQKLKLEELRKERQEVKTETRKERIEDTLGMGEQKTYNIGEEKHTVKLDFYGEKLVEQSDRSIQGIFVADFVIDDSKVSLSRKESAVVNNVKITFLEPSIKIVGDLGLIGVRFLLEYQEIKPQLFEQIKLEERLPIKRPESTLTQPVPAPGSNVSETEVVKESIEVKTDEETQVIKEELRIGY